MNKYTISIAHRVVYSYTVEAEEEEEASEIAMQIFENSENSDKSGEILEDEADIIEIEEL